MNLNGTIFLLMSLLCTPGCTKENRSLVPPGDTKWVYIEIKAPPNTEAAPLSAFYTSNQCYKVKYNSDMKEYKAKDTHVNYVRMERDKNSGNYITKIPIDGGGLCQWRLGQLTLGIEYSHTEHLIKNANIGNAVGVIVAFDNVERENGIYQLIDNDMSLSPIYYPIIKERFSVNKGIYLSLFGKESFELYKFNSDSKKNVTINFSPVLDESKVVRMIGPKEKKSGSYWRIEYPDGSVTSNGDTAPNFDKLNAM